MKHAWTALLITAPALAQCGDLDFNNDGVYPSDQDTIDFANVLAGADCPTCDSIDFNGDGVFPDDADLTAYLAVLAGGPCPTTGFTPITQGGPRVRVQPGETIASVYQRLRWSGGVIEIPAGTYNEAIKWPDQESLPYGNVTFVGIPGPSGERPLLIVPRGSAGARINASNIRIHGIAFDASLASVGIAIVGDVSGVLIEDCEIRGGAIGVSIEGQASPLSTIRIRRNIIADQRSPVSHSQGIYAATGHTLVIEDNAIINTGNRDIFSHGMYLVHNRVCQRIVTGNWIISPGSAAIQARGGEYTIDRNVVADANTAIGTGHPMAFNPTNPAATVWTSGTVSSNLMADSRAGEPAQWGGSYMLGKVTTWRDNTITGIARPWMSSVDQGGAAARVPVGEVVRINNTVKPERTGIDWAAKARELTSRKPGEWDADRHGTAKVIERAKE